MLKRSLRIKVMAAMFSAAFLFGTIQGNAYTYSNVTSTVDKISEDENDLIITNNSKIIANIYNFTPNKRTNKQEKIISDELQIRFGAVPGGTDVQPTDAPVMITGIPSKMTESMYNDFYNIFTVYKVGTNSTHILSAINDFNTKYNASIKANFSTDYYFGDYLLTQLVKDILSYKNNQIQINSNVRKLGGGWSYQSIEKNNKQTFYLANSIILENASITISNNSTLNGKGLIQTSKTINVTGDSFLKADGSITGGDVYSDKAIISSTKDSGESIISSGNITATGTLKSDTYIGAVSGAVSGKTVYSGGDIVSANSIKAGGLAKGNALNVAAINATTASITGNQSINGVFTTTGQAKLNGGAALGGKKITGLSIGTLSTTSTDAVNGKQLYTAMQSSGKTYAAGSDISISSANAISVAKAGKVASGNTGIMTGDAVYQETSKIDSVFKSHNTSITSNNSKLDSLTTSIESLRKSLGTINSSVSDAISGLPGSLANFANKDLTDLSDTGINTLKSYIKSEIKKQMPSNTKTASYAMEGVVTKDTSAIDNVIASKANTSDLTAMGSKVDSKADKSAVSLVGDNNNAKADLGYVNDGLDKKADKSVVEAVGRDVDKNTSATAKNTASIQSNTEAISGLIDSKADVFGSNMDVSSWSNKLGTGTVAKDDIGLVTGSSVAAALDKKADIGYVAIGLGAMEGSLEQVNQSVTKDVSRVGAGASALMGLHPTGDKFEFATAYGHYKNSNNTALGVFYKPSTNSTVSVAGTIGDGDAMLSAGVSVKLGLNKEVKKVITPNEFSEMKSAVDSQDEKLDQMEKTLQQLMAR